MRIILSVFLWAASAHADEPATVTARQHYQKATAFFNLGEWEDAAGEYKAAYKALPEPVFLYNIAQAYRLAGDLQKAAFFYNSYALNAKDPATKREAEGRAKKLEAMIASGKKTVAKTELPPEPQTKTPAEPSPAGALLAPLEGGDSPGPAWSGASERLGSMTDLIKTHRDQFRFCFDAWSKKHPKIDGHLKLTLMLAPDGKLEQAEAHATGVTAPELERCIVAMARQLSYPPSASGKMTRFNYPFEFKAH